MSPRFAGVILSGGRSSRMGASKALLTFGANRLVDHVAARLQPQVSRLYLNSNDPDIVLPGVTSFADRFDGFAGPLAGIHASLAVVGGHGDNATHIGILPVDTPFFPPNLMERLESVLSGPDDIALAMSCGRMHPVIGLWPILAASRLQAWLQNPPTFKVRAFLDGLPVHTVEFAPISTALGELDPFFNVNTPDDLERARKILDAAGLV